MDATAWFSSSVTKGPPKTTKLPKRLGYTDVEEEDEDGDVPLNLQMGPLEDDFVAEPSVQCTLTQEAAEAGNAYAPYFPTDVADEIHVGLTSHGVGKTVLAVESSDDVSREVEVKFQFWSPENKGTYEYQVFVKSSCYVGCDVEKHFKFKVVGADQIPKLEAHPLDESLAHMPTWQELMLNPDGDSPELSDSEDSDEDDDSEEANKSPQR